MSEYASINKSAVPTTQTLGSYISIPGKTTQEYTIEFRYVEDPDVDQSDDMGKSFSGKLEIVEGKPTLYTQLLNDNPTHTGSRPNAFNGVYTDDNTGVMYVASGNQTEDGSPVYYFAGNAKNNWVKFGKESTGSDLYWRIIRTNEDGSVRMLYAGTSPDTTEGYIEAEQVYNTQNKDPMYVGYMYGTSGTLESNRNNINNSDIKTIIDNWYAVGLNTQTDTNGNTYNNYVSRTAIYCNDRAHEGTYSTISNFSYAAIYRLESNNVPSYKCGNDKDGNLYSTTSNKDKFSSINEEAKLTYPVALMTADEVSFAGGLKANNAATWYYYNSEKESITGSKYWWTMTPYSFVSKTYPSVHSVLGATYPGRLNNDYVSIHALVRPVLSLKSCALWKTGNGSSDTPYEVEINNTCALLEN